MIVSKSKVDHPTLTMFRRLGAVDVDMETLKFLRERADHALGNLAAPAKTLATGSRMSPVCGCCRNEAKSLEEQ